MTDPMFNAGAGAAPPVIPESEIRYGDAKQTAALLFPTTRPPAAPAPMQKSWNQETSELLFPTDNKPTSAPAPAAPASTEAKPPAPAQQQQQQQPAVQPGAIPGVADEKMALAINTAAKAAGIESAVLQRLFTEMQPALQARAQEQLAEQRSKWRQEALTDGEIDTGDVRHALVVFGDPGLTELLRDSGLADNPAVLRLLSRAGRAISRQGR
jgi:hypothetical protein